MGVLIDVCICIVLLLSKALSCRSICDLGKVSAANGTMREDAWIRVDLVHLTKFLIEQFLALRCEAMLVLLYTNEVETPAQEVSSEMAFRDR